MHLGGFADTVLSVLLGWVTGIVQWVFSLLNGRSGSLLAWFGKYWLVIAAILVGAGLIIDWLVWLIRWQPYHIWAARARRFGRWITRKPPEEEEDEAMDAQATARYVPVRRGEYAGAQDELDEEDEFLDDDEAYLDEDDEYFDEDEEYLDEDEEYLDEDESELEQDLPPDPAYAAQMAYQRPPQREKLPPQPEIPDTQLRDYPGKRFDPDLLPYPPLSARDEELEAAEAPYDAPPEEEIYDEEPYDEALDDEALYEDEDDAYSEEDDIDFAPGYAERYDEEEDLEDMGDTRQRRRAAEQPISAGRSGARDTEFATFDGDTQRMAQQRALYGRPHSETASNAMAEYDADSAGRRRRRAAQRGPDIETESSRAPRRQPRRERVETQPAPEPPRRRGLFAPRQDDPDVDDWYSDEPTAAQHEPQHNTVAERRAHAAPKQDKPERKVPSVVQRVMQYAEQRLDPTQPKKRGKLMQLFDPQEERVTGLPPRVDKDQAYSAPTMPKPREEVYEDWYEDE